jgi:lysyl-tRNA synthetase class 2
MSRSLTFRQSAAVGVAAVGIEAVLSAATPNYARGQRVLAALAPPALPSLAHLLALLAGLALVMLVPKLWHGTRTAVSLAIAGLGLLAVLNLVKGLDYDESLLDLSLAALMALGRGAFPLGCRNRPRLTVVCGALGAWALSYCAVLMGSLASDRGHTIKQALHASLGQPRLSGAWTLLTEALIACAVVISLLALRSLLRPGVAVDGHTEAEYRAARAIVERHGADSLAPFILRPDKAFHFAGDGVLAYRVIGETAVVSADPVGPPGTAAEVLGSFLELAREHGWRVILWGAGAAHVESYRALGLRSVRVGEEAFVDPRRFTLEGRRVRKLRQSVNRLTRRGWHVSVFQGRELATAVEADLDALQAAWRAGQPRVVGFAMGMGACEPDRRPSDMYVLARSPAGELRAAMRFVAYCGGLSLDTMHRVGETPNGLNEALIALALEHARGHGVSEVSLNYAGLAHLVHREADSRIVFRCFRAALLRLLGRRFQLERLVHFDEKFLPEWRPRYLISPSRAGLPRAALRALQAEGYLPQPGPLRAPGMRRTPTPALPGSPQADAAR